MRTLVIDRKIWLRGEGDSSGQLLRPDDGKMCCIGIYLEACGVPKELLKGQDVAHSGVVMPVLPEEAQWLVAGIHCAMAQPDAQAAYAINDDALAWKDDDGDNDNEDREPTLADAWTEAKYREEKLAKIFAKHDVEVVFTN